MKRIGYLLLILVALVAVPLLFSNRIIAHYTTNLIEEYTGLQASFDAIDVGLLRPVVRVSNLVLSNPPDFPHPEMLTVKEFYVRYDRLSLLSDHIRLEEVRLDVPRVVMVKPQGRESNIELLTGSMGKAKESPAPREVARGDAPTAPGGQPSPSSREATSAKPGKQLTIDRLNVKLDEMEVRQYGSDQTDPLILPVPIGLNRKFENVTDLQAVMHQLSLELAARSAVGMLGNIDAVLNTVLDEDGKLDKRAREQLRDLKKLFRQ